MAPGLGLGLGMGHGTGIAAPANPNLLLWTEQLGQPIWVGVGDVTLVENAGLAPDGTMTADELSFGAQGALFGQTSTTAATTGAVASRTISLTGGWVRESLSGTFDGTIYLASVYLIEPVATGADIQLRLERSGGFLLVSLRDAGDSPILRAWGWKLETPSFSAYVKRDGT